MIPLLVLSACTKRTPAEIEQNGADIINIGGIGLDDVSANVQGGQPFTKTVSLDYVPAEEQSWLLDPLFDGLEVRYRLGTGAPTIARLRLHKDSQGNIEREPNGLAKYTLKYLDEDFEAETTDARWKGNGEHLFQGVYVPENIRKKDGSDPAVAKAENLTTDQAGANYELLNHYLAMPANTKINATTGRVILPYGHRLCHVIAYVLIDPAMGDNVHLQGFQLDAQGNDDPHSTLFRFGNVDVLDYVEQTGQHSANERLIPHWTTPRKVIPHFFGMRESRNSHSEVVAETFIIYQDTKTKTDIFPTQDDLWTSAKEKWEAKYEESKAATEQGKIDYANKNSGYEKIDYGRKVPCYDIIVRPTYTSEDNIMYDEAAGAKWGRKNKIDFELTLDTGLSYSKTFEFLLDANYQTVVFLKINQVAVDYNEAGSEKWVYDWNYDGYYGVNNRNGNALSKTGSSWQRAYRIGEKSKNWDVTDGHKYDNNDGTAPEDRDTLSQYVNLDTWMDIFKQACMLEDESNPGSYTVPGKKTGDYFILDQDITIDLSKTETGELPKPFIFTGHLDCQGHTITLKNAGKKIFTPGKEEGFIETTDYTQKVYEKVGTSGTKSDYVEYKLPDEIYEKVSDDPVTYEQIIGLTLQDFMEDTGTTYYRKTGENTYEAISRPAGGKLYMWYPGEFHFTPSYLFAGLNGIYNAPAGAPEGTYNIHTQGGVKVPYADNGPGGTGTGWRAEILNARIVKGENSDRATLFPDEVYVNGSYVVGDVSGYVYNCTQMGSRVPDHVPARPKY